MNLRLTFTRMTVRLQYREGNKALTSPVRHDEGSVLSWAYMAANGTAYRCLLMMLLWVEVVE